MTVHNVLVVGGGVTGSVTAIALAQRGVNVTLVEIAPEWYGVGHGITIQGNALLSFQRIGALERILERGKPFNELTICHADGHVIQTLQTPRTGGTDLPATLGALRSELQGVLVDMIHELGVRVLLGRELEAFTNHHDSIEARLSDGTTLSYDLIVAADGIKSKTRAMLGIHHDKKPSGLGIWRVVTARTPSMKSSAVFYGGPEFKAGYTTISDDLCYAYVLTDPVRPDNGLTDAEEMKRLLAGYHGDFDFIRQNISESDYMNFQPIEWLFVDDQPWHVGRIIAIGDAVHACPPLIAQGAAQCSEDAVLLAEYLTREGDIDSLLTEYTERRKPRLKIVVEASLQLVDWELHPDTPGADTAKLMGASLGALTAPA
jgi:2-polyprenyl-6-methoxyphenol hydroxylase-like FAD-dependent oxidoreductase